MQTIPVVLTVAGSDSGGGAGIQADIKTIQACGGFATTAVTAITAQNTVQVTAVHPVPREVVMAQVEAVFDDFPVVAVKTGMIGDPDVVRDLARWLARRPGVFLVVDPVISSKGGHRLADEETVAALKQHLLPLAAIVTPNRFEAEILSGRSLLHPRDMAAAAGELVSAGCRAAVVTGGGFDEDECVDLLRDAEGSIELRAARIDTRSDHGTGCTFSAAIATFLGLGLGLRDAVSRAKEYVTAAIAHGLPYGSGHRPTDHFHFLRGE